MTYLRLIYDRESTLQAMSEAEGAAFLAEYGHVTPERIASGKMLGGEELVPFAAAALTAARTRVHHRG